MGTGTHLGLPRRTHCFDGSAQRGRAARHCRRPRPSAEGKSQSRYWGWSDAGLALRKAGRGPGRSAKVNSGGGREARGAEQREGRRGRGGSSAPSGSGWWEGPGLAVPGGWDSARRQPPRQRGRRRALTSQGRSASRLGPGGCPDSDPPLRCGTAARQDADSPPPAPAPAPGLRRGSPGGRSASPQAPPPRPAAANWSPGRPRTRSARGPRVLGRPRSCACAGPARLVHTLD